MELIQNDINNDLIPNNNDTNTQVQTSKFTTHIPEYQVTTNHNLTDRKINLPKFEKLTSGKQFTSEYKYSLFKKYVEDDTSKFTADDWIYLIIKMGKRLMAPNKLKQLHSIFTANDLPMVLKKRAELQYLRNELEDIVYKSKHHVRSNLYLGKLKYTDLFSEDQLIQLVIKAKAQDFKFPKVSSKLLYSTEALQDDCHNPFFTELLIACHTNNDFSPHNINIGRQITDYINNVDEQICNDNEANKLAKILADKQATRNICGGRTLQLIDNQGKVFYFKFQRNNENFNDFTREQKMHKALADLSLTETFSSEVPHNKGLFKLAIDELDQSIKFDDALQINVSADGKQYVYVYCFTASTDYVEYAWHLDQTNLNNPHEKSILGLKKAAKDIGTYASYGIVFDSIIKAQHSISGIPKWSTLANLAEEQSKNVDAFPGSISGWVKETIRSDLAWSGLRDLGDSQFIDEIYANLAADSFLKNNLAFPVSTVLGYMNALLDNIIAITVIYSRGMRQNPDYHYENIEIINAVKIFIEDILQEFLSGFFHDDTINLKNIMDISDDDYNNWLDRTATEIVYWTAIQPEEITAKFKDSPYDHQHNNYSSHIKKTKFLDKNLYPEQEDDVHTIQLNDNIKSDYSLGITHCHGFPFQALIKGTSRMLTNIIHLIDKDAEGVPDSVS
jgi:hypothetical protein